MLPSSEDEVKMQFFFEGRPINATVPLYLIPHIFEDDCFRRDFLKHYENGDNKKDCFKWTFEATTSLINKYKSEMVIFHNPAVKRSAVWAKIARQMQKEGLHVNSYMCQRKFNLLKASYKLIKGKMKTGRTRKHWEFFKLMDDLYASNIEIRSKLSLTAIPTPSISLQDVSVQTFFDDYISQTSVESCRASELLITKHNFEQSDLNIDGLKKIDEEMRRRGYKEFEENFDISDGYKNQLLEIERERLKEFRRFNDTYSRIAAALEEKNNLYQRSLNGDI